MPNISVKIRTDQYMSCVVKCLHNQFGFMFAIKHAISMD